MDELTEGVIEALKTASVSQLQAFFSKHRDDVQVIDSAPVAEAVSALKERLTSLELSDEQRQEVESVIESVATDDVGRVLSGVALALSGQLEGEARESVENAVVETGEQLGVKVARFPVATLEQTEPVPASDDEPDSADEDPAEGEGEATTEDEVEAATEEEGPAADPKVERLEFRLDARDALDAACEAVGQLPQSERFRDRILGQVESRIEAGEIRTEDAARKAVEAIAQEYLRAAEDLGVTGSRFPGIEPTRVTEDETDEHPASALCY